MVKFSSATTSPAGTARSSSLTAAWAGGAPSLLHAESAASTSASRPPTARRTQQAGSVHRLSGNSIREATATLRIAVVDDDETVHASVRLMLARLRPTWTVDCYLSGQDAIEGLAQRLPDVVLMDIRMPGMSGIDCTRKLTALFPRLPVLMHTARADTEGVLLSLIVGAAGCLIKPVPDDALVSAIEDVLHGGRPLSPAARHDLVEAFHPSGQTARLLRRLTPREQEILVGLFLGRRDKDLADKLDISIRTVNAHTESIFKKLRVHCRREVVRKFFDLR